MLAKPGETTIFTKPGCPYCAAAKDDMKQRGVSYAEFNVRERRDCEQEALVHSRGKRVVPIIVKPDGAVQLGFNGH